MSVYILMILPPIITITNILSLDVYGTQLNYPDYVIIYEYGVTWG